MALAPPDVGVDVAVDPTRRIGRVELAILGAAAWLLVVWSPSLDLGLLTPRQAAALVLAGPGLVVAVGLARRGDLGARWLVGLIGWAFVAALVAPHPRLALIGSYGSEVGWIWMAASAGAWGVGRRLRPRAHRPLQVVLAIGLGIQVLLAVLEAVVDPEGVLGAADGRVRGLVPSPVFLAGLLTGGLALAGWRAGATRARWGLLVAAVAPLAAATNLSGSRSALVGGAVVAVVATGAGVRAAGRPATEGVVRVGLVVVAIVLGVLVSLPLQGAESGTERLSDTASSAGYASRTMAWGYGLDAWTERPIAGWGPGRFREATSPRTTAAFVRAEGPDKLFYDAHNIFVEHLVTTGLVGLVLLVGFVVVAVRSARGPLAWFAGGIAVTWLLNPPSATTAPLALLALGAAWQARAPVPRVSSSPRVGRTVGAVLASLGLLVGVDLLVADAFVHQATTTGDLDAARTAQRLLPGDSVITDLVTEAHVQRISYREGDDGEPAAALASARRATREEPTRATWWSARGRIEGTFGPGDRAADVAAAERAFREALERSPWSAEAMQGMLVSAHLRKDRADEAYWTRRLCEIDQCPEG